MWANSFVLLIRVTVRCRRMVDRGGAGDHFGVRQGLLSDSALGSVEAGLVSVLFLSVMFATIGPWFDRTIASILLGLSATAGLVGLAWAHRASHGVRRRPTETAGPYARLGAALSLGGILGSTYYSGILFLSLFVLGPLLFLALVGVVLFVVFHAESKKGEAAFLRGFDASTNSAVCLRCGSRVHIADGCWRGPVWVCARCAAKEWGVAS